MKYRALIILFLLCVLCTPVLAQDSGMITQNLNSNSNSLSGKIIGKKYVLTPLANSNFLFPGDWVNATIYCNNGDVFENRRIKYHAFDDELIAYNENNSMLLFVDKQLVEKFIFTEAGKKREFHSYMHRNKNRYYELLYKGNNNLLSRRYVYAKQVRPYIDKLGIMRDVEYVFRSEFFLENIDGEIHKLHLSKKSLIEINPQNKKEMRKILRRNRVVINSEEALLQAFRLIDDAQLFN